MLAPCTAATRPSQQKEKIKICRDNNNRNDGKRGQRKQEQIGAVHASHHVNHIYHNIQVIRSCLTSALLVNGAFAAFGFGYCPAPRCGLLFSEAKVPRNQKSGALSVIG
jgi:hypothetical protein